MAFGTLLNEFALIGKAFTLAVGTWLSINNDYGQLMTVVVSTRLQGIGGEYCKKSSGIIESWKHGTTALLTGSGLQVEDAVLGRALVIFTQQPDR